MTQFFSRSGVRSGGLLLAAILVFIASPVQADPILDIVISEIMYHPPGNDDLEFVEITNKGGQTVDLSGWTLRDGLEYDFPPGTTIAPGAYRVIASDPATMTAVYGLANVLGPFTKNLANDGERIEIRDPDDGLVGEVEYDDKAPWPEGGDDDGRSIELIDVTKNANVGRHWLPSSRILGSPGQPNSPALPPVPVFINEFVYDSSGDDWIELYNAGNVAVNLNGYHLTDNPKSPTKSTISSAWSMGTTIIPAKGYWYSTQSDWGFGLSSTGEQVYLVAPDGVTWVDGYDFGASFGEDYSEGRYPDGNSSWRRMPNPTPLAANLDPTQSAIVINEIMYHPTGDTPSDPGREYVELRNTSGSPVDLTGWRFTQGIDYDFPPGTVIPAGGYLVVAYNPAAVQSHYGIGGVLGPYTGRLSNFSDELEIEDALENRADYVEYRQEGLWPESPDGIGPSLELANTFMDNRLPGAWRASSGSGTPGAANSQSVANPAASIDRVRHTPLVPTSSQSVTVSARVGAGNLTSVTLFYKDDDAGSWSNTAMFDDGLHGDELAGDGIFGGTIPAFANNKTVEFYVSALATGGNTTYPPSAGANNSCLYSVRNTVPNSNLTIFRIVATRESSQGVLNSSNCSNFPSDDTRFNCTFITETRAYYDCEFRRRSGARCGPKYSYKVYLTPGYHFRDSDRFDLNFEKGDETLLRNKVVYHLLDYMDLPSSRTEFIHTRYNSYHAPGTSNGYAGVHLYVEAHNDDFIDKYLPDDSEGNLYKAVAPWTTSVGGTNIAWGGNHGWYEKETNESANDWSDLDNLHNVTKPSYPSSLYENAVRNAVDVENWGASMAVWGITCLIDSPWHINNQNYRIYRRFSDDRFVYILHDFDDTYWDTTWDGFGATASQFADVNRWWNHPPFQRVFAHHIWRAVNLTDGVYRDDKIMAEVHFYHELIKSDVLADPNTDITKFLNSVDGVNSDPSAVWDTRLRGRNQLLRNQLNPYIVPLAITTNNGQPITTGSTNLLLAGTAPISAADLEVDGEIGNVTWTSNTQWQANVTLELMSDTIVVRTLDHDGIATGQVTIDVTCTVCTPNEVDFGTAALPTAIPYMVEFFDESSASNIIAWDWDFGDGGTSTLQNPSYTFDQWGVTYDVSLTIQADGGPYTVVKPITVGTPIKADWDQDGDIDLDDYGDFQVCMSGSGITQSNPDCADAKLDGDDDVDSVDQGIFISCMDGPEIPAVTNCQ